MKIMKKFTLPIVAAMACFACFSCSNDSFFIEESDYQGRSIAFSDEYADYVIVMNKVEWMMRNPIFSSDSITKDAKKDYALELERAMTSSHKLLEILNECYPIYSSYDCYQKEELLQFAIENNQKLKKIFTPKSTRRITRSSNDNPEAYVYSNLTVSGFSKAIYDDYSYVLEAVHSYGATSTCAIGYAFMDGSGMLFLKSEANGFTPCYPDFNGPKPQYAIFYTGVNLDVSDDLLYKSLSSSEKSFVNEVNSRYTTNIIPILVGDNTETTWYRCLIFY